MPSSRTIRFPGATGASLAARLDTPADERPVAWALFAHCFTCTKNVRAAVDVSRALAAERIAVLRFDFTGLGESEGDFADTNFSSNVEDLEAAAAFMERELEAPSVLVGHSLGGAAVLRAAHGLPSVRAVCTIAAPADPAHVLRHVEASRDEIERDGEAVVHLSGRPFRVREQFLRDVEAASDPERLAELHRALLLFHSPVDEVVGIENAERIYHRARHPKSFVSLDGADHLLSDSRDSAHVARVLGAWARRYVDPPETEPDLETLRGEDRVVVRTGAEGFRTDVLARGHALVADEPVSVGGDDAGPTPYDLVVAGLGACTSMTLRMYADRKGWPLEEVRVRLRHDRVHREDEERCEDDDRAKIDRIRRWIELRGDLDGDQRARLLEIAGRCPVHRTLSAGVIVESSLEERAWEDSNLRPAD